MFESRRGALFFVGLEEPDAVVILTTERYEADRVRWQVGKRVWNFAEKLLSRIQALEKTLGDKDLREAQTRAQSAQFRNAVSVGAEEVSRTVEESKIDQFAAVIAGSLVPTELGDHDIPTMIRDIAQLGDTDIKVLGLLADVYGSLANADLYSNDAAVMTGRLSVQLQVMRDSGINPNDFLASCARLSGFGLALDENRTPGDLLCAASTRPGAAWSYGNISRTTAINQLILAVDKRRESAARHSLHWFH